MVTTIRKGMFCRGALQIIAILALRTSQTSSLLLIEGTDSYSLTVMQEMKKEGTAFKHPNCGGIVMQYEQDGILIYECDRCGKSAEDIDRLVLRSLVIIRQGTQQPTAPD